MGAYSGEAKLAQTNAIARGTAPAIKAGFVTIAAETVIVPEASAIGTKIKKTAHGLPNGAIVVFTEINGIKIEPSGENEGKVVAGLTLGTPYRVVETAANEFAVARTAGGAAVAFTAEIKITTSIHHIEEHTGAKTKRQATAFTEATDATGLIAKDAAREVEASAGVTVVWEIYWSAEEAGTLIGIAKAAEAKTLGLGDIYRITSGELSENAAQ